MKPGARILNASAAICLLAARLTAQESCEDLKELLVGRGEGRPGEVVAVDVVGGASCEVTGFSAAIGIDSRIRFVEASPGNFLTKHAGDDLAFQVNGRNEAYVVIGAIFDLSFPLTVPPTPIEKGTVLATLSFEVVEGASGVVPLLNRTLTYGENVPVSNVFSRRPGEAPLQPFLGDGSITILPPAPEPRFARGDANADGRFDISDPIQILHHLFLGASRGLDCQKSADLDDSGVLDITDPVYLLRHLFLGERPPAPPYPLCGADPTDDPLPCPSHSSCD